MLAAAVAAPAAEPNQPARPPLDMSASDVGESLTRMLLDKPKVPVTLPKGAARPAGHSELPVAGSLVIDRLCRLTDEAGSQWTVLAFEDEPGRRREMPRRALPCRLLERMESLAARSPSLRFRVTGETTIFRRHAYLLVRKATVCEAPPAAAAPKVQPKIVPPAPAPGDAKTQPSQPATRPAADDGREPTSDDLLKKLLSEKVGRPVQPRSVAPEQPQAPSVAPGAGRTLPAGRGGMLVDRLVRIVPELTGQWWTARFEADNTLQEPPMRLLPCLALERAQDTPSRWRGAAVPVLRASGEVTHYKQRRYLLIRKLLRERRMSRF